MTALHHEPETKGFNKARDFQDAIIRARKSGCTDPLQVADAIYDWFMDASRTVQVATLQYAVGRIWSTTESKIADVIEAEADDTADIEVPDNDVEALEPVETASPRMNAVVAMPTKKAARLAIEERQSIKEKVREELDRKWLDVVIPMTGAQVRAAKLLPDDMADKVGDAQRVGEVFSVDELRALKP